jgi:hypothetical protein
MSIQKGFSKTKNIVDLILTQNFTNQIFHLFSTELRPKFDIQFSVEKFFGLFVRVKNKWMSPVRYDKNNKYFSLICRCSVFLPICCPKYFPMANSDFRSFIKILTDKSINSSFMTKNSRIQLNN